MYIGMDISNKKVIITNYDYEMAGLVYAGQLESLNISRQAYERKKIKEAKEEEAKKQQSIEQLNPKSPSDVNPTNTPPDNSNKIPSSKVRPPIPMMQQGM